jgi:hypothetical protein
MGACITTCVMDAAPRQNGVYPGKTFRDYDSVKSRSRIRCLLNVHLSTLEKGGYEGGDYRKLMPIGAFDDHEACEHVVRVEKRRFWSRLVNSVGSHVEWGLGPSLLTDLKWWSSPLSLVF